MQLCVGQHCPPGLDDAMLVANWTLRSSMGSDASAPPGPHGTYSDCPDGRRQFVYDTPRTGSGYDFGFDANGHLTYWSSFDNRPDAGACNSTAVCGSTIGSNDADCSSCQMLGDPPPAGSTVVPRGRSNGPDPTCEIDANGRWSMPQLAPQ
jgi:hypothetical protein